MRPNAPAPRDVSTLQPSREPSTLNAARGGGTRRFPIVEVNKANLGFVFSECRDEGSNLTNPEGLKLGSSEPCSHPLLLPFRAAALRSLQPTLKAILLLLACLECTHCLRRLRRLRCLRSDQALHPQREPWTQPNTCFLYTPLPSSLRIPSTSFPRFELCSILFTHAQVASPSFETPGPG
jgi:hypothetical protein